MTEPTLDHLRALAERCKARDSGALREYPEVAKLLLESFTGEESERQRLWQAIVDLNSDTMERGALNLLPCPFCGTSRETIIGGVAGLNLAGLDDGFWVECLGCGASAEQRATQVEAVAAWNRRHPEPVPEALC